MSISVGARVGPYEILSLLGTGGMGEVYKARDARLGREVAIKVIPEDFLETEERRSRFEREARVLAALNHPSIGAIYSFEEISGRHLLVMELLEGESLRARLESGALPARKAVELAVQIANGLAAAHEKGIVHRDLKPENVFVTKEGRVKILDFGLAKLTQPGPVTDLTSAPTTPPATTAGVALGTVGYMSPEQVRGEKVDARSDIFAFGAVLYEMLSGKRAFQGASAVETMHAILKEDPPELAGIQPGISFSLERITRRCLEKSPDERIQSARDLAFDLEVLSGSSAPTATPALPFSRKRSPARLAAAAIALAVVAVTAGLFAGSRRYKTSVPTLRQLTFRRGEVGFARFTPDAQSVVYGAAWEGKPMELFSTRLDSPEARPLGLPPGDLLAVSPTGKMAICLGGRRGPGYKQIGTFAEAPLGGGAPREILRDTKGADFSRDGSALAVVHIEKGKFRLEYPIGTVLYESQNIIAFPRISPSGDLIAFFSTFGEENLWALAVVDRTGNVRVLSRGWDPVSGLAWLPGTNELWFSAGKNVEFLGLFSIKAGNREELRWQPHGLFGLQDISQDGRFLMSIGSFRSGLISLSPHETKERDLSWFGFSQASGLSADGRQVLFQEYFGGESGAGTYLRSTDGSGPAVRLGEGEAQALSPDGQWAIAIVPHSPSELLLLPTGAGPRKIVRVPGITCERAAWFPDGERVVVQGQEKGHGMRLYVVDLSHGDPRAITPEGSVLGLVSPDGRSVLARAEDGKWLLYPLEGGTPHPVSGMDSIETPSGWSADGRTLFLHKAKPPNANLFRLDLRTGRRELWKAILTSDPAGTQIGATIVAADGHSYAYGYRTSVSDLYLVQGLR